MPTFWRLVHWRVQAVAVVAAVAPVAAQQIVLLTMGMSADLHTAPEAAVALTSSSVRLHTVHPLHSRQSHAYVLTVAVSSAENCRHDGCPLCPHAPHDTISSRTPS